MNPTRMVVSPGGRRLLVGAIVAAVFFVSVILFLRERGREAEAFRSALGAHAGLHAQGLVKEIEEHLATLALIADWYREDRQAGGPVRPLAVLARLIQSRSSDLFMLAEAVREPLQGGGAAYRVMWVEPSGVRPLAPGRDLGADPLFASLVAQAGRTRRLAASARVPCPEKDGGYDVWLVQPLLRHQYDEGVPAEGGAPPAGLLVAVLDVADIMERVLGGSEAADLAWSLTDDAAPAGEEKLYATGEIPAAASPVWSASIPISAGRSWTIAARPGPAFVAAHRSRQSLPMLLGGLASALLLGALLTQLLGRTEQVESEVRERTASLTREIAERERAEAGLRESEGRYRALAENAEDLIYIAGLDERIVYANAAAARSAGRSAAELVGVPVAAFTPGTPQEETERIMAELLAGRTVRQAFPAILGGQSLWLDLVLVPLRNDAREVSGILGIARDVTARRVMEEQLRVAKEVAEEAARAKADFLATMSHEIRTPLNGIIGTVGLLLDAPLPARERELAAIAQASAGVLLALIDDILDFSRIEAQRLALEPVSFDPVRLLEEAASILAAAAAGKGLELAVRPAAGVPRWVVGDAGRIRQVLLNLAGNAVKFTDRGQVLLTVEGDGGDGLRFCVADTGPGIEEAEQKRIFERFVRGDSSTTRRHGGTGLGLAISHSLVELLGGSIGVESRPGAGARFWFRLPLPPAPAPEPPPGAPPEGTAAPAPAGGRRVLVAEDNPINQRVAVLTLESLGCRADVAADGAAAVAMAGRVPYDLVLMDCEMPGMDGFAATREIRRREAEGGRRLRIVAMTARSGGEDRERCRAAGMDDFLGKPVSPRQLAALLGAEPRRVEEGVGGGAGADAGTPALDPGKAGDLRRICVTRERWEHLAGLFESGVGELLGRLRAAVASGDAEQLRAAAHKLRGASANFGARAMAEICARFDGGGGSGDCDASGILGELEAEWARVDVALGAERRRWGDGG